MKNLDRVIKSRVKHVFISLLVLTVHTAEAIGPGQALAPPIQALSLPPDDPLRVPGGSSVARDAAGNFVVVWASQFSTSNYRMDARLFAAGGIPRGAQFMIDSARANPRSGSEVPIAVAMDARGDFVVAWVSNDPPDPADSRRDMIYVKVFNQDGTPRGERIVAGVTPRPQGPNSSSLITPPAIAMDASGDFLVAWVSQDRILQGVVSSFRLNARRYSLDGTPLGDATTLAQNGTASFINSDVRIAVSESGEFVVVYQPGIALQQGYPFYARLYRANGQLTPLPIRLDTTLDLQPFISKAEFAISFAGNDELLLAWSTPDRVDPNKQTQEKIFVRRYSLLGFGKGLPVQVATRSPSASFLFGTSLSLAPIPSGGFAVTWSDVSGPGAGIYGRYYAAGETPLAPPFFIATPLPANTGPSGRPLANATTDAQGNLLATFGSVYAQIFKGP